MQQESAETAVVPFQPAAPARTAETAATAAAEQAKAATQARYVMAWQRPRDIDEVRVRLLKECRRPRFAAVAIFTKPIGKKEDWPTGPSIRFAEVAIRCMRNILVETQAIYDDKDKRIVRVTTTDLEANATYDKDVVIEKTVERRFAKDRDIVSERTNSTGQKIYIVRSTEDELLAKEGAIVSKTIRTNGMRLIPGDLVDEGVEVVEETKRLAAKNDPGGQRKKVVDAFMRLKVGPSELKAYIGKSDLDTLTADEIVELQGVYQSVNEADDHAAAWKEIKEAKLEASKSDADNSVELKKLRTALAKLRTQDSDAVDTALDQGGYDPGVHPDKIPIEDLRKIVAAAQKGGKS